MFTPALAALVLLPGLWLHPQTLPPGLQVRLSGARLRVLILGWPLAMIVLAGVAAVVWMLGQNGFSSVVSPWLWVGLAPTTLALCIGGLLRRWLPANLVLQHTYFETRKRVFCPMSSLQMLAMPRGMAVFFA